MASRRDEDAHMRAIQRLLSETSLVCTRSPQESVASHKASEEARGDEESSSEELSEGTADIVMEEMEEEHIPSPEESPRIFPTPSLRRVLPDNIREIEKQNRIYVLPEEFKYSIDPLAIPVIAQTIEGEYIDILAGLVGCKAYKSSLPEYWFLDTLAGLLRRAQSDGLDRQAQAVLIVWFCEWMKEMQHLDAATRKRMLSRFKDNMLSAGKFVAEYNWIPKPKEVGVWHEALPQLEALAKPGAEVKMDLDNAMQVAFGNTRFECSLRDLITIMHYIYDMFSTDYQYELVRSVFTFGPDYNVIDAMHKYNMPKRIFTPYKPLPKKEKKEKPDKADKAAKGKKKGTEGVLTAEYLALMELIEKEQRELEEIEEGEREEYHRRNTILPLMMAVEPNFCEHWWPPPPPPEPEPEPLKKVNPKKK